MAKQLKEIEITFGAKDSELYGWEYTIPDGMEATIVGNKIVVKKKESEDERIRKEIINYFECQSRDEPTRKDIHNKWIAWLEKHGEQETDEWKEGNIIRHGGILALVVKGRRAMKSNGELFTVQYPKEWVKAVPNEIECFLNELEKQGEQKSIDDLTQQEAMDIAVAKCFEQGEQKPTDEEMKEILRTEYEKGRADAIAEMQNTAWSEEDEKILSDIIKDLVHPWNEYIPDRIEDEIKWLKNKLKTLKDRVQPQQKQEWSEDIINRGIKEVGLTQYQIDWLKRNVFYPPKPEWSEEDETARNNIIDKLAILKSRAVDGGAEKEICEMEINWLKSLHPQNKQEWTQDDIDMIDWLIRCCEKEHEELCNDRYGHQDIVSDLKRDCRKKWDWLESLKERVAPQSHWKPSEGQLECLGNAIDKAEKDYPTSD